MGNGGPVFLSGFNFSELPLDERRSLCTDSTLAWAMNDRPKFWKPYYHSLELDSAINDCFSGVDPYVMISLPPRFGKTSFSVLYGGTRYFCLNPDHNVYYVTYSGDSARDVGAEAKRIAEDNAGLFGLELDPKRRSDIRWGFKGHHGTFNCIGVNGKITGKKVHLLIADDLFKNDQEVISPAIRNKRWSWWINTADQRIQNNEELQTKVLMIGTRWHDEDVMGRTISNEQAGIGRKYRKVLFPAVVQEDISRDGNLIRKKGDALCPEILSLEEFEIKRATMDRQFFNAVFLCRPIGQDGLLWSASLFDDSVWVDEWPLSTELVSLSIAVDPALGKNMSRGDYSAVVAVGVGMDELVYVEADMAKDGIHKMARRVSQFLSRLPMLPDFISVETIGFQESAAEALVLALEEVGVDLPVLHVSKEHFPDRIDNKQYRIQHCLDPMICQKDFRFVRSIGNVILVNQLKGFPSAGVHDDGPDALEIGVYTTGMLG